MAKEAVRERTEEEQAEHDRVAAFRKVAAEDRAREEARRAARVKLAKEQVSVISHGPVRS